MYGDGTSKRDYTFVADIVSGILAALEKNHKYEIFNLGNSNTVQLKDLISTIEKLTGKKAKIVIKPMPMGDVPITYEDIKKSRKMLGYEPKTDIVEGMKSFTEWYNKEAR
jgi:UDP-glucuronate 4-epimerase